MTDLIACLSTGKGTIGHVEKVIEGMKWGKIFLVTDEMFKDEFNCSKEVEMIIVDKSKTITDMAIEIKAALSGKISDLEVGLNIVSGEGREHMAIISALLSLGLGIRLIALTKEGVRGI